jgi:hypothetical protein
MSIKRLYVGNLAPDTTADEVRGAFAGFGPVLSVTLEKDPFTGRPRGYGYVEMEDGDGAAIAGLNRKDLRGYCLTVCGARPRNPEPLSALLDVGQARTTDAAPEPRMVSKPFHR